MPTDKIDPDDLPPGVTPDCRPINIGNTERCHITRAYFDEDPQSTYNEILGPVKKGVGIRGGISITAFGVQTVVDTSPGFASIQGYIKNGYIEVERLLAEDLKNGGLKRQPAKSKCYIDSPHRVDA